MPNRSLPTGTVTFLFTDIEGSTKMWEAHQETMRVSLARHDALMRQAIGASNGYVFKIIGDAFCAAFATAAEALDAVLAAQLALWSEPWPEYTPIRVRMALHTGAVETRDDDFFGPPVNRVARLLSTAHGGQSVLSQTTYDLVRDDLPAETSLRNLGEHRLKDLGRPESVFQMVHPKILDDFPPLRSLDNPELKHNLPQQVTSFVGREAQIADVKALLEKTRLLTLTGAGGSGKTRLALQAAADMLDGSGDGVWLVELAPLTDPALVPSTVASVLGLKEEVNKNLTQTLTEHLKSRHLLLVLDNCEHLLDACAKLADSLLRGCPRVLILATSREGLGIAGELTYRVPSLSSPDPKRDITPESLTHFEAVRLFIERAQFHLPQFAVTNDNAPALASVCHRLDGIPLAIELAAARVRSLSVQEVNQKLDQRFRLLTGGSRTALPRQQTLRSLIDWSYDLLTEAEKAMLCRLSVFSGGWTLESAEKVFAGDPVEDWEVLDLLTSLSDKSLVVSDQKDGATRYRLLETVRQYARDRLLENGEGEQWRDRQLHYFLALAEVANPKLFGPEQRIWLDRLETEHDNLRAALEWSCAEGADSDAGLRLATLIWRFWNARGYYGEGRGWLTALLISESGDRRSVARAGALGAAGFLALQQSDYAAARALLEEALAIFRELGDRSGIAASLKHLGNVAHEQADYAGARALQEESLAIRRELGDPWGIANTLDGLGLVASDQGDYPAARSLFEESLAIKREIGDQRTIALTLNNLGLVPYQQGDYAAARALLEESLAIRRELGDRGGNANTLSNLGNVVLEQGDHASALALHRESLAVFHEIGDRRNVAFAFEGLAATLAAMGSLARAARLWGASERLREEIACPLPLCDRPRYEQQVSSARAALGDDVAFDAAWAEGRAMTMEQAVALALQESAD